MEEVRGLAEHELTDGIVAKIRFLLDAQYNEEQIALGIRLLGDAPFSTLDVEQAHGSLAVIRRYHQGFALASFVYRSYLHMVRHFFCEGAIERRGRKLLERRADFMQKQKKPKSMTGRLFYLKLLFCQLKDRLPMKTRMSKETRQELMRQHGRMWKPLPPQAMRQYDRMAKAFRKRRDRELDDDVKFNEASYNIFAARVKRQRLLEGLTPRPEELRLKPTDFDILEFWSRSPAFGRSAVRRLLVSALEPPEAPSKEQVDFLDSLDDPHHRAPKPDASQWVKAVCNHREHFVDCVFAKGIAEGDTGFLFLFAKQSPYSVGCLELVIDRQAIPCFQAGASGNMCDREWGWHQHRWRHAGVYASETSLGFLDASTIVLSMVSFGEGPFLESDTEPRLLSDVVKKLPMPAMSTESGQPRASKLKVGADILEQLPWLAEYIAPRGFKSAASGTEAFADGAERPIDEEAPIEVEVPIDVEAVYTALEERRRELHVLPEDGDDFKVTVRGGAWTARERGRIADCVSAQCAKGSLAATWCAKYHLYRMQSYSLARYGDVGASQLAEAWCRKMQWMYNLWFSQDDADFVYTAAVLATYREKAEFTEWLEGLPLGSPITERAWALERIRPKL